MVTQIKKACLGDIMIQLVRQHTGTFQLISSVKRHTHIKQEEDLQ